MSMHDGGHAVWDWTPQSLARLERFLELHGITWGAVSTARIGDGHSNLTYLVTSADGTRVIVRRPPPPPLPPGGHDMLREARFMAALQGTGIPVPRILATAGVDEVLDVSFYVMSVADGPVITTATPDALADPAIRRQLAESMVDTLADLHTVDWRARGLSDAGKSEGFNARHLRSLRRLVANSDGQSPPEFRAVESWLEGNTPPESGAAIVHNDYRIGNVVAAPAAPGRVLAILDWELATIGDPMFDLGYFIASIPEPDAPLTPTEELGIAMFEPGYPSRRELAERYAARTGADVSGLAWYSTLALWKLAVLYEYGRRRAESGAGDDYYSAEQVSSFLAAAHRTAELEVS